MIDRINKYLEVIKDYSVESTDDLEQFKIRFSGKKGLINQLFDEFKSVTPEQKRETGKKLNDLKQAVAQKIEVLTSLLDAKDANPETLMDLSLPGDMLKLGSRHPVSIIRNEMIDIFSRLGFVISEGPEIEDDWHVFSALNFPPEHPARDMQDTFFISRNPDIMLRTHTSSVQIRVMENQEPPIRTISPGRVFRKEAISARSHCIFHQVEGLYIDENVSFADLKQTLMYFAREMFGHDTRIRLRPSYFPFTEPSGEMDISCTCKGKGCPLCKNTGWLEILGCGMVDPNVLQSNNIDPVKYTGYAFGIGIERIALLKFKIKDIRMLFENDIRLLDQFIPAI